MVCRPNILWILTDEQRVDSLGYAPSPWARTPHWDRLAAAACCYDCAYTPSPVCVPARVAMMTGYRPSTAGVYTIHDPLGPEHARFLTHRFAAAGYQTASFGKQHVNCDSDRAFETEHFCVVGDRVKPMGYVEPIDAEAMGVVQYPGDEGSRWLLAGRYPGLLDDLPEADLTRRAIDWLDRRDAGRPFFLRVSFNGPHTPVVAPAPWDTDIDPDTIDLPIDRDPDRCVALPPALHEALIERSGIHRLTDEQVRRIRRCYFGLVGALDQLVGRLLDHLDTAGLMGNTIIAFCSDHGTHLGDHGFVQKQSFFEPSARVPLLIRYPDPQPRRLPQPVSTGSLLPTLMRYCALDVPDDVEYPTLPADALEPTAPVIGEIGYGQRGGRPGDRYVMLRHGRWKLCVFRDRHQPERLSQDDGLMLFDLDADPHERINLASDAAHRDTLKGLCDELERCDRDSRGYWLDRSAPTAAG